MARARDLAGLAALGALAYHLRPGKDLKTETQNTGADPDAAMGAGAVSPEDARGNAEMARMAALDNPDFEPGMYTKEPGGDSAPAPARAAPTRSAAAAPARAPARPAPRPSAGMNNSAGGRGPGFGEVEAYRQQQYEAAQRQAATPAARAARQAAIEGQAAENMTGDFIPMGRLAKAAGSAGTALAKFAGPKALGMSERKALEMAERKGLGSPEPRALANNPTRQITGPSKADLVARDRAARAAARERGMLEENAARYNLDPSDPAFAAQAAAVRSSLGGKDFTLRKKGGKVKTKKMASGGMSSASKRADGIATRGKTKYKIY
jgi:hypothetical protein